MRILGDGTLAALVMAAAACSPLFACVGDDPGGHISSEPRISAFTAAPAKLPFGGGRATLEFSVDEAQEITIEPGVGDVTGRSSVEVDLKATTTFVLVARSAAGSVTATATVEVALTPTVAGRVQAAGAPVPNVTVAVSGKPPVSTNERGEFTVVDVTPPYDVTIVDGDARATVYLGLRQLAPTLVPLTGPRPGAQPRQADVISGIVGGFDGAGGDSGTVSVSGPHWLRGSVGVKHDGAFELLGPLHKWNGPKQALGTVYAWKRTRTERAFFGSAGVRLEEGGTIDVGTIPLSEVGWGTIHASVSGPAAYASRTEVHCGVAFEGQIGTLGHQQKMTSVAEPLPIAELPCRTLKAPGSVMFVAAFYPPLEILTAETSGAWKAAPTADTADLSVSLAEPARPEFPADGATNVTRSTRFGIVPSPSGGIHVVSFEAAPVALRIVSAESAITLPDLSAFSIALPKGKPVTWSVKSYAPLSSLDAPDLAAFLDVPDRALPRVAEAYITTSAKRTFTTAP